MQLSFQIENFPQIRYAYGSAVAAEVLGDLRQIIADVIGSDGTVLAGGDGGLQVVMRDPSSLGGGSRSAACQRLVETFCGAMSLMALDTSAGPLCLWVSGSWVAREVSAADVLALAVESGGTSHCFLGLPVRREAGWAARYRADMTRVVKVMTSLGRDFASQPQQLTLFWQPVCDGDTVLYHEALPHWVCTDGKPVSLADDISALERLGFVRFLDRYVVAQVVAELETSPDALLGVNISSQSLWRDCWWDEIEHRLSRMPGVAGRLFIEITQTTALPDVAKAAYFVARMRRLGCQVVLDDFGAGFTSIRHGLALSPKILKIGRHFLRRAHGTEQGRATFVHLVHLAQSLDACVVIAGVETEAEAELAWQVGVSWQQGSYWARPTACRSWRWLAPNDGKPLDEADETAEAPRLPAERHDVAR